MRADAMRVLTDDGFAAPGVAVPAPLSGARLAHIADAAAFELLYGANPIPTWIFDPESLRLLEVNRTAVRRYGFTRDRFLAMALDDLCVDRVSGPSLTPRNLSGVVRRRHLLAGGRVITTRVTEQLVIFNGVLACLAMAEDITDRERVERRVRERALHDQLTRLAAPALFWDRLDRAVARLSRADTGVAVVLVEVAGLERVNRELGRAVGDWVLVATAGRIQDCLRPCDSAARLGGGRFAVLLEEVAEAGLPEAVAQRVVDAVRHAFTSGELSVHLDAVAGIAHAATGANTDEMLRDAEAALDASSSIGPGAVRVYQGDRQRHRAERLELIDDLRQAVERGELRVLYQPKMELSTGRIVGAEALARWLSPQRGGVAPEVFIALAEESGLIGAIDAHVMETACREARRWQDLGLGRLSVAVNVSAAGFAEGDLAGTVIGALERTGLKGSSLEVEMTETAAAGRPAAALVALLRLRSAGVRIAIDDFGTGYSGLSSLRDLPGDVVKIDQSFVREVAAESDSAPLLEAAIAMGHAVGMEVVAEGVETEAQLAWLRRHNCDLAQGYLIGRPVTGDELVGMISGRITRAEMAPWPAGG